MEHKKCTNICKWDFAWYLRGRGFRTKDNRRARLVRLGGLSQKVWASQKARAGVTLFPPVHTHRDAHPASRPLVTGGHANKRTMQVRSSDEAGPGAHVSREIRVAAKSSQQRAQKMREPILETVLADPPQPLSQTLTTLGIMCLISVLREERLLQSFGQQDSPCAGLQELR
jgi:hypothetical protein|mmetsp:Transcript_8945/g.13690  ORF Transcript_8945/g.13690 Transcript_8945/m.13690 type:complete len:171 (+) Transcript_8945:844-1356(+)